MTTETVRNVRRKAVQRWTRPDNHTAGLYLGVLLLGSFVGMLYLYLASQTATTGYAIGVAETRRDALQRQNDDLRVEIARWSSLPVVRERAEKELGMVESPDMSFVNITVYTSSVVSANNPGRASAKAAPPAGAAAARPELPNPLAWLGGLFADKKATP